MLVDDYDDSEQILDYYYNEDQDEPCVHYWDQLNSKEQGDTKQRDEMRPSSHDREEPQEGLEPAAKSPRLSSSPVRRRYNTQQQLPQQQQPRRSAFQRSHVPTRSIGGTVYYSPAKKTASSAPGGVFADNITTNANNNINTPLGGSTPLSPKQSAFGRSTAPFASSSPRGNMNSSSPRVNGLPRSTTLPNGLSSAAFPAGLVNSPRLSHASPRAAQAALSPRAAQASLSPALMSSPRAGYAALTSPRPAHASLATPGSGSRHNSGSYQSPTATNASLFSPRSQTSDIATSPLEYPPKPPAVGLTRSQTIQSFGHLAPAPAEPVALSRRNSYTPQGNRLWDEMTVLKERIRKLKLPSDASASSSQSQTSDTSSTSQTSLHSSPPKEPRQRFTRPRANTQEPRVREPWDSARARNRTSWQEPVPAAQTYAPPPPPPPPPPPSYPATTAAERHLVEVTERAKRSLSSQRLQNIMLERVVSDTIALYHTATDETQIEAIDKTCLSLADFIAHYDTEDPPQQPQLDDSPAPLSASLVGPPPPRRFTTARPRPVSMYNRYSSPLTRSANEETIDEAFSSPLRYTPSRRS